MFSNTLKLVAIYILTFPFFIGCFWSKYDYDGSVYPPVMESMLSYLSESLEWDAQEPKDQENILTKYDFIVVGAGSAGAVVANRLSEIPQWNVLLIEAGRKSSHIMDIPVLAILFQATEINWKYSSVSKNNSCLSFDEQRCKIPRGKVMGGSSVLNFMIYTRGNKKDYDSWVAMGNEGWGYDQVLKYFIKSERANLSRSDESFHGKDGLLWVNDVPYKSHVSETFIKSASQIGHPIIDINGDKQIGANYLQTTMMNGRRWSTNAAFLFPARKRKNLHVKKYSTVTKILIDSVSKTAIGVEFVNGRKKYRVYARKEVIVSSGAINSPQLLMLSGIGPEAHLKEKGIPVLRNLPVGENLMDHVSLGSVFILINNTISMKMNRCLNNPYITYNFSVGHGGPASLPGGTEALAFFDTQKPNDPNGYPDLELLLLSTSYTADTALHRYFGMRKDFYNKVYYPVRNKDSFMIFPMVMRPKSRGRVWLKDTNPFHYPLIDPNYFADEADLDVIVAGVRIIQKMLKTDAMRQLDAQILTTPLPGCTDISFDSDAYWKCAARQISYSIYHLSGTCKMGPIGDPTAVVDPRLRVHGIKHLRVIDASIIPEIPVAHTNAPTIMIGEKGADMIKEDWNVPF
ncbi:glucose dehydrogenase [FAD, quinone]-like [Daktulosphaira vitifoliae]|uniref:glucose dehydrogenase [FAD, quinone]-like n=1 Tax=Daktulosphaira vitifoliae TaxID=58002 RepID=UPI0021AABF87|nr:glucose dehydrogenase [FAD, quinone]-like [Daktulosphaira vitifoliae]